MVLERKISFSTAIYWLKSKWRYESRLCDMNNNHINTLSDENNSLVCMCVCERETER